MIILRQKEYSIFDSYKKSQCDYIRNGESHYLGEKSEIELPWTKENIEKYKSPGNMLCHARYTKKTNGTFLVSLTGDLIGYIAWEGNMIIALEVTKSYQRKGYAKKLLKQAISEGCTELTVDPKNEAAINLYRSLGFKKVGLAGKNIKMKMIRRKE